MARLTHGPDEIVDPGAKLSWYTQHEQQMFAKRDDDENLDDGPNDEDSDPDDDEGSDPDADKDEETLRAELKAVRASLSVASGSSKTKRDKIKRLERELGDARASVGKPKPKDDEDEKPDLDAIRTAARLEAKAESDKLRKADRAELALARANVDPVRLTKAIRLLDLDDVDLNDDGTLDGIEDAIEKLKDEEPSWFVKRRRRDSVAGGHDDGSGDEGRKKTLTASEAQARRLTGRAR